MDSNILNGILNTRLNVPYRVVQFPYDNEPKVEFLNSSDDTTENQAIITDAIDNYTEYSQTYTLRLLREQAVSSIQSILDNQAKEYGFDNIHTAAVWKDSQNAARKKKSQDLLNWGDDVWDFAENEWALQAAGTPTYTDIESFLAALPVFTPSE